MSSTTRWNVGRKSLAAVAVAGVGLLFVTQPVDRSQPTIVSASEGDDHASADSDGASRSDDVALSVAQIDAIIAEEAPAELGSSERASQSSAALSSRAYEYADADKARRNADTAGLPAFVAVQEIAQNEVDELVDRLGDRGAVEVPRRDGWPSNMRLLVIDRRPSYYQEILIGGGRLVNLGAEHADTHGLIQGWVDRVARRLAS